MTDENKLQTEEKRGRPLDLSRNKVILETTLNLIADNGYDSLTIEAVAKKAQVGKGTIYRRWSTKEKLVVDAAIQMSPFEISKMQLQKDQDLRGQLIDLLSLLFMEENKNYQKAMNAICDAVAWDEQLGIREAFYKSFSEVMKSILEPYIQANAISDDDMELITDIGPALITYKLQFKSDADNTSYVERLVDKLILPMVSKPA